MKYIGVLFSLFFVTFLTACRHNATDGPSEKQLQAIFDHADSLALNGKNAHQTSYIDSALRTFPHLSDEVLFRKYNRAAGDVNNAGNAQKGLEYLDSALVVINKHDLKDTLWASNYLRTYIGKGFIQFQMGREKEAIESFFKAKQVNVSPCSDLHFADHYTGLVLFREKRYRQARDMFIQAIRAIDECHKKKWYSEKAELTNDIALCYTELKVRDSARLYYRKAIFFLDSVTATGDLWYSKTEGQKYNEIHKGIILGSIGRLFASEGKADSAEAYFRESIRLNSKYTPERRDAQARQADLAQLYFDSRRFAEASTILSELQQSLDTLKNDAVRLNWRELSYKIDDQQQKPAKALAGYKSYIVMRDSINSVQQNSTGSNITEELKNKSQVLEISLLKKTNEVSRGYLWITGILIFFALIIIGMVTRNNRRDWKNLKVLTGLNSQISDQKADLEIANRDKERLMQVVAHDLRSPVGMTAYAADLMLMEDNLDAGTSEGLNKIKQASSNALTLINELLAVHGTNNKASDFEKTDLDKFVETGIEMSVHKANEKGQQITYSGPNNPVIVSIVPNDISRLLSNLLNNALKFSGEKAIISVTVSSEDQYALLTVKDSGIGIPVSMRENIFEFLTPSRQAGTAGEASFGLGLSICKRIAEEHSGSISFESEVNGGTSFYVRLPLSDDLEKA